MADTGRTVWADGLWADDFWAAGLWAADEPVLVPDVVGELEADAVTAIEAVGLTASVSTAYSSVVAAGLVISQDPAGGIEVAPGSQVSIVVSLGEAPVIENRGGDDVPRAVKHPGYDLKRAKLKLNKEKQLERELRDLFKELTGSPQTAERAESIVEGIAPPVSADSAEPQEDRATVVAKRLRQIDEAAIQGETALRLLYKELREEQERDDEETIMQLLSRVL